MKVSGITRDAAVQVKGHIVAGTCFCEVCNRWYYQRECRAWNNKFYCPKGHENKIKIDFAAYM